MVGGGYWGRTKGRRMWAGCGLVTLGATDSDFFFFFLLSFILGRTRIVFEGKIGELYINILFSAFLEKFPVPGSLGLWWELLPQDKAPGWSESASGFALSSL